MDLSIFENRDLTHALFGGLIGVEVEEQRINANSKTISRKPHHFNMGNGNHDSHFQTDFALSMEELVTDPQPTANLVVEQLHSLQWELYRNLDDNESIWPLSMPPKLSPDDVEFEKRNFEPSWAEYRNHLTNRYNIFEQLICGIHLSYSPAEHLLTWYQQRHQIKETIKARDELLFKIAQQVIGYRWLITFLFGASPLSENANDTLPASVRANEPVRSIRQSKFGYTNKPEVAVSYASYDHFLNSIEDNVNTGKLYGLREFYGPIRMKGQQTIPEYRDKGAKYVECRLFDLNPFSDNGIGTLEINFLKLVIMDELVSDREWGSAELNSADFLNNMIALESADAGLIDFMAEEALNLLERMEVIANHAPKEERDDLLCAVQFGKKAVLNPGKTFATRLVPDIHDNSLMDYGMKRSQELKQLYARENH